MKAGVNRIQGRNSNFLDFNGDGSTSYSQVNFRGNGSTSNTSKGNSQSVIIVDYYNPPSSSISSYGQIHINGYTNTNRYKTAVIRSNTYDTGVSLEGAMWRNSSAITSITLRTASGNFAIGSTFDLYGISTAAAQNASATGGTDIFYDSTYAYHVFKGSGTFTPARALTADVLVVAGGGGLDAGGEVGDGERAIGDGSAGGVEEAASDFTGGALGEGECGEG